MARLYTEAVPLWINLKRNYPGLMPVQAGLTTALVGSGRKSDALQAAEALANMLENTPDPGLSEDECTSLNSIAVSLEKWGIHNLAADLFAHVAGTSSSIRGKAKFSLAKNLNLAGSYSDALPVWLELQEEFPGILEVRMGKAEALEGTQETHKAIQAYEEVIDLAGAGDGGNNKFTLSEEASERIRVLKGR